MFSFSVIIYIFNFKYNGLICFFFALFKVFPNIFVDFIFEYVEHCNSKNS